MRASMKDLVQMMEDDEKKVPGFVDVCELTWEMKHMSVHLLFVLLYLFVHGA